ncbi:hypothetical protein [Nitrobacter sp.]
MTIVRSSKPVLDTNSGGHPAAAGPDDAQIAQGERLPKRVRDHHA